MATAGSIVIDLLMKTGAFETDAKRAEKRMQQLSKEAQAAGKAIGAAIGAGAVAVATGLTVLVKSAIDSADAMRDLSIRVGVSTEVLSAYGYAASQTGTDIDTLAKGLKVLAKNAADSLNPTSEQAKVFEALGIEVAGADGKLRDLGELIPEIADRFKAMEDGTTKAALAQALFGRAGLELTELLNQGSAGLAEFTDRARELGLVLDSETAAAADDFNDTLGDLRAVTQGYALALAKELLPDLQNLADSFRNTATEGNRVAEMAQGTADFLRGLATVAHIVSSAFEIVGTGIATVVAQGHAAVKLLTGDLRGAISLYRTASQGFGAELDEAFGRNQQVPRPDFSNVRGSPTTAPAVDSAAVARALSNPTATRGSKGGKSEAQKAAEDLERAYQSLNQRMEEQIALFGETTEAAKVRYEIEHGALQGIDAAKAAQLIRDAEHVDLLGEIAEHEQIAADAAREYADEQKRLTEQREDVLQTIRDEIDLVSMSADQQEIWNNLKWAGVDAESEWGRAIIASTQELQRQRDAMDDQIALMDGIRDAGRGLFEDLMDGSKGFKEAFTDALDTIVDRINQIVAENLIDQLFGKQGDPAGGSTGGWFSNLLGSLAGGGGGSTGGASGSGGGFWSSLIGSLFGGARADGGGVDADRAFLVGERGPELFVPRTAGMVLSTQQTSRAMSGGGMNLTNNFAFAAPTTARTQTQVASRVGFEVRRSQRLGS